jgi:cell division protein FtsL
MAPALAYQQPVRREREQPTRQPLRVLPGKRTQTETQQGLAPFWRVVFTVGIMAVLMTGVVWVARVGLANATMETLANSAQVTQDTEAARSEGSHLEVEYAFATNPASIQEAAATQLGMAPDPRVDYLRIPTND